MLCEGIVYLRKNIPAVNIRKIKLGHPGFVRGWQLYGCTALYEKSGFNNLRVYLWLKS